MFVRLAHLLAFAILLHAPLAPAETLGESINVRLGPDGAAALAELPSETLAALHAASGLTTAHSLGLASDAAVARGLSSLADELADGAPALAGLDPQAFRVAMVLHARVLVAPLRELALTLPDGLARSELIGAGSRLVSALASVVDQRVDAGEAGPDNPCFQQYAGCMRFCSERSDAVERALCGMDCNLDFAACVGTAIGRGIGALIGTLDDITRGAPTPAGR